MGFGARSVLTISFVGFDIRISSSSRFLCTQ
jgi:hypothetical protein